MKKIKWGDVVVTEGPERLLGRVVVQSENR